jgi:urease accessory protein
MINKRQILLASSAFILAMLPTVVNAHVGTHSFGFVDGLKHPLGGLDHILAMVAVGLWAVQLSGKAIWGLPVTFLGVMVLGGVVGMNTIPLPFVEQGIIASDLILGLLVLIGTRLPLTLGMAVVGLLAIFHGYAHGAEMPENTMVFGYVSGFMLSTAFLHLLGVGVAMLIKNFTQESFVKIAGGAIVLGSLYVLATSF